MVPERRPALSILGIRGIPARYGGFETFAERLAIHLVERDWDIEVYCQEDGDPGEVRNRPSQYRGVTLRRIHVGPGGAFRTMVFDWKSMRHATAEPGRLLLSLGYNCAVFATLSRLLGRTNIVNMDGIEWRRQRWSPPLRAWLWCNERLACWLHDHLIADHPAIADHLATRVAREHITTVPYGADRIDDADPAPLAALGLRPRNFVLMIGRPVQENLILEIVRAFSRRRRGVTLVVLGTIAAEHGAYPRAILDAASEEVVFPGAIYDPAVVAALRAHCLLHVHGHQVGGTNPSLVEALGAGSAILAHDNRFNRWVCGASAAFFADEEGCARELDRLLAAPEGVLAEMRAASLARHAAEFTWPVVLARYEALLTHWWEHGIARDGVERLAPIGTG